MPTVQNITTQDFPTDTDPHVVDIPVGWSIGAGELLLIFYESNESGGYSANTTTDSTGDSWTTLYDNLSFANAKFATYYKTADGDEAGETVSITKGVSFDTGTSILCHITGWNSIEASTIFTQVNTANANPPSLSPSWGADETLWMVHCFKHDLNIAVSSYPTNYTSNQTEIFPSAGDGGTQAIASRTANAATEDPDSLVWSSADNHVQAVTIAIEPTAASSATMDVSNNITYDLNDSASATSSMSVSQGISYDMTDSGASQAVQSISNAITYDINQSGTAQATQTITNAITYGQSVSFGNISAMSVSIGASTYDLTASGTSQTTATVVNDLVLDLSSSMNARAVMSVSNDIAYAITVATQAVASMGITTDYSLDISVSTSEITATITVPDSRTITFRVQDRTIVMPDQDRIIKITS